MPEAADWMPEAYRAIAPTFPGLFQPPADDETRITSTREVIKDACGVLGNRTTQSTAQARFDNPQYKPTGDVSWSLFQSEDRDGQRWQVDQYAVRSHLMTVPRGFAAGVIAHVAAAVGFAVAVENLFPET